MGINGSRIGPVVVGIGRDVRAKKGSAGVHDGDSPSEVEAKVVGPQNRRTPLVVGQEDTGLLQYAQLLGVAEHATPAANGGLRVDLEVPHQL